jgi:hypothetical protein
MATRMPLVSDTPLMRRIRKQVYRHFKREAKHKQYREHERAAVRAAIHSEKHHDTGRQDQSEGQQAPQGS